MKKRKDAGLGVSPRQSCQDKNCPFHGNLKLRGKSFIGTVVSTKSHKTATVEWERSYFIPKYERFEKRRTKIQVHNPKCINAKEGDKVMIMQSRPLSKTKNFVIVRIVGKEKMFEEKEEREEEAKHKEKEKSEEKKEEKVTKEAEVK